jgi:DNA-binding MarR family transcriptional regulator
VNSSQAIASPTGPDLAATADRLLEVMPRVMRRIRQQMRQEGARGLTVPQLRALLFVRRNPGTDLSQLAEHVGVSLPAGSALVERLVRADLLDRATDPGERRRLQLHLTALGAERAARAHLAARTWVSRELAGLPADALGSLYDALALLDRLGDDTPAAKR